MNRSANGAVIVVLGILSWVGFGCLTGLPAWILGNQSLRLMREGRVDSGEAGLVNAGRILGMISCIIVFVIVGVYLLAIAGVIGLVALSSRTR